MNKTIGLKKVMSSIFFILILLFSIDAYAQKASINGNVIDQSGLPLVGVTVVEKGTTNGTTTNINGEFNLSVETNSILKFSFIGMQTVEKAVSGQTEISIKMFDKAIGIEDVVAVGYGSQRKADLTGAIEVVEMQSIENVTLSSGNPMQALQGRVPGLLIEKTGSASGATTRVLIRGVNTLGNNDPLYIIDGIATTRAEVFQSLSPSSIESIQVLKDASASSIYGSRASNGVIIVTTKIGSGKESGMKVQFNSSYSIQSEKKQRFEMLNALERGQVLWQASVNDRTKPERGYGEIYNFDWNGDRDNPILNNITLQPFVGGNENVPVGDTDWQEESYDPASVINNDLTITGGTENSSILMNLNYIKNTGMLAFTNYDRISARVNAQGTKFDGKFKIGMNTQVVSSNETLDGVDMGNGGIPWIAFTLAPTIPLRTLTGEYAGPEGSGYTDRNNPVHVQDWNKWDVTTRSFFYGNSYAEIRPVKNLVFRTMFGVDYSTIKRKDIDPIVSEGFLVRPMNDLTNFRSEFTSLTWTNTATYELKFGSSRFNFLLGTEAISNNYSDFTGYIEGFKAENEEYFVLSAGTQNGSVSGTGTSSKLLSQFGKINYNLSNKYLASLTLRRDGSSRFGSENRYGLFPAATFGWRINEEDFMNTIGQLSNLKLRVGAGRVGNQEIGDFASRGLFEPRYGPSAIEVTGYNHHFPEWWNVGTAYDLNGIDTGNLPSGFISTQGANPGLRWESTDELNLGIDFGFFNSKIMGAFDYFTRKTTGILIQPPIASAMGEGQLQWMNGATKTNSGWEFNLSFVSDVKNDFSYSISTGASHFIDKITELPEEVRTAYPGNSEQTIIGHSQFSIFGYVTDGLFQNQEEVDAHADQVGAGPGRIRYVDLNNDSIINALDQKFIGNTLPRLEYSLRVDLNYKNFDFSVFGSGLAGRYSFDDFRFFNNLIRGRENGGVGLLDAWNEENSNSTIPALTLTDKNNETRPSDYFYVNSSYFKLRNLSLGYSFSPEASSKIGLEKVRIYIMADNLFWIDTKEFTGPDPERQGSNGIPVPTSFTVGLNVTF
ncbi:MAG: SusC/RagA family TonB-linked outer membrane protein [Prolixibacteraceae bacterium]